MKKIIWITSYPKSGNTWMRYLISNYFFNDQNIFDPNIIRFIDTLHFPKDISKKDNNKFLDPKKIASYWIPSQKKIIDNINNNIFLKNHNANLIFDGHSFTNEDYTLAVIKIVRDPRDIIVSSKNYWGGEYDEIINKICHQNFFTINNSQEAGKLEIISTWGANLHSWINTMPKIPKILVRYEDLIKDCKGVFTKIIQFLSNILNTTVDMEKIKFSVENSNFKKLSKSEDKYGFNENLGKNRKFFRKGEVSQFKKELKNYQIREIESCFKDEMIALKYL